jgi:two-component system response regulator LytT
MKLRALVVEDEWVARNYLVELLEGTGVAEVVAAVDTVAAAREVLDSLAIDVAFVDIQLVGSDDDGLALVRERRAPLFVLATAHPQHALAAYDLGVADYLTKPFTASRVEQCVLRLRPRITPAAAPARIVARKKRALVFLRADEVWAFEASDRLAYVHTARGTFDIDLSLAAIEASFGRAFLRTHRNWLVNTDHVLELSEQGDVIAGELRVPVARERATAVREALLANTAGIRAR